MNKTHVAVLMGGASSEHDVSIKSGAMVAGNLDIARFEISRIVIGRDGGWQFPEEEPVSLYDAVARLRALNPDCVFPVLHGPYGEDGRLQGMLDLLGLPYVGSGCAASALAIDKVRCKAVVKEAGIAVARQLVWSREAVLAGPEAFAERIADEIGLPCVVKSPCQGSSLGMAIPRTREELVQCLPDVAACGQEVMAEEFVEGSEVTCGVWDPEPGKSPVPLPVTEICPVTSAFFDYHAKYIPGACEEITPARISDAVTRNVQEVAKRVHRAVGCRGLSRSDMILRDDEPVWLEVNTIPGMTQTSLFPQAAAAVGISFPELVGRLVESAIAWHEYDKGPAPHAV